MKVRKVVKIRVDGGSKMGHGHLIRCFSLAKMLSPVYEIYFHCIAATEQFICEVKKSSFHFIFIENETQFLTNLLKNDIVVLDHYGLDSNYQKIIKQKGCKLVCIDDLKDKFYHADLIINHALGVKEEDYEAIPSANFALGVKYALLRPLFIKASQKTINTKKNYLSFENVLICFGGSDINNLTKKVVEMLLEIDPSRNISVIVGASYIHYNSLTEIETDKLTILSSLSEEEMFNQMQICDFSILPSSSVLFEMCSVSKPIIGGYYADNQREAYNSFLDEQMIVGLGDFNQLTINILKSQLLELTSGNKAQILKERQRKIFNGSIQENILSKFKEIAI